MNGATFRAARLRLALLLGLGVVALLLLRWSDHDARRRLAGTVDAVTYLADIRRDVTLALLSAELRDDRSRAQDALLDGAARQLVGALRFGAGGAHATSRRRRTTLPPTLRIEGEEPSVAHRDTVLADSAQLHQAVMNLVINASQALHGHGTVRLRVQHEDGEPSPPEAHGGRSAVDSTPGVGTRFDVHLPASEAQPLAEALRASATTAPTAGLRVLLVDDEPALLAATRRNLARHSHTVVACMEPLDALARLRDETVDVLLADLSMPAWTAARSFGRHALVIRRSRASS
jgi:hypothetical protein